MVRPSRGRRGWARRRGATTVELSLVLLPLFMFLLGTFEYSRYLLTRNLADNAAREGARYAVVHTYDKSMSDVKAQVTGMLGGLDRNIESLSVSVYRANPATGAATGTWTDARFGDGIAVEITGVYRPVLPDLLLMGSTVPFQAKSVMRSEAN